jgi:putative phosphoesterase
VLADTHVFAHGTRRLDPAVPALFARHEVGLILHAGDVNTASVLRALEEVAPVLAVQGNGDDDGLRASLPLVVRFRVGRFSFVLLHGHGDKTARTAARRHAGRVDGVVYGHSHIAKAEIVDGTLLFNPGSATDRRWQPHFGVGVIRVTPDRVVPELILFDDPRHLANVQEPVGRPPVLKDR